MSYESTAHILQAYYTDRHDAALTRAISPGSLLHRLGSFIADPPSAADCRQAIISADNLLQVQPPGRQVANLQANLVKQTATEDLPAFKRTASALAIAGTMPGLRPAAQTVLQRYTQAKLFEATERFDQGTVGQLQLQGYDGLQRLSQQPYDARTGRTYNWFRYPLITDAITKVIGAKTFNPADFRDELFALTHTKVQPQPPLPQPTIATGWELIRPDVFQSAIEPDRAGRTKDRKLSDFDVAKLRYLAVLHNDWDPHQPLRIAAVSLKSNGQRDYWGLILGRTDSDQETVVLESARTDRATLILKDVVDWQKLFPNTSRGLRQAGAVKRTHGPNYQLNVLKTLTEPVK